MEFGGNPDVVYVGEDEGEDFPWERCSFGYKINPDGDNPAEVLIYSGRVDLNKDDVVNVAYQSLDTKITISGTQSVWVRCRVLPTGMGDPWPLLNIFVEKGATVSGLTYWVSYKLYTFVAANNTATPPAMVIDDEQTIIHRFLDIERDGGGSIPDGTEANPHLVWDHDAGEWVIGVIVPPGSESLPHLIWNHDTSIWEAGKLYTLPEGGDTYCVAIWSPEEDAWIALDMEEGAYKVLGMDVSNNPIMDYVRWV